MWRRLLREEILQAALDCGNEDAVLTARQVFDTWQAENETLAPNLRSVVYKAAVRLVPFIIIIINII